MLRAGDASLSEDLITILLCLLFFINFWGHLIDIFLDQRKALEGANCNHYFNHLLAVCYVVLQKVLKRVVLFLCLKP